MINRSLSCFLIILTVGVLLFSAFIPLEGRAAILYQEQYEIAASLLKDLMNEEITRKARELFSQLGSFKYSKEFVVYLDAVQLLKQDDIEEAVWYLEPLKRVQGFSEELSEKMLPSCDSLLTYAQARTMEAAWYYNEAVEFYSQANVLDSLDRIISIQRGLSKGSLISFSSTATVIPSPRPQPFPAPSKTPKPTRPLPTSLTITTLQYKKNKGIEIAWQSLGRDYTYTVYRRWAKGANYSPITTTTKSSFLDSYPSKPGYMYYYYVEAADKNGRTITSSIRRVTVGK